LLKALYIFWLAVIPLANANQSYTFTHRDCIIRYKAPLPDAPELTNTLVEHLTKHGLKPAPLLENKRLLEGELYILVKKHLVQDKIIFKDCIVKISIHKSERNRIQKSDRVIYQKESKRSFPRVTAKGTERCVRALKDAFVHIPYCRRP
jgi:hypothetical protein